MAMKAGLPVPPEVLDYSPIPSTLAVEWKKLLQAKGSGPTPEQMQQMQDQIQKLTAENTQLKAKNEAAMATVQVRAQESQAKTSITAAESQSEMQRRAEQQQFDQMLAMREFMAEVQQTRHEMALAREELAGKQALARAAQRDTDAD